MSSRSSANKYSPTCVICGETPWNVSKHEFPKDPELKAKWISILKLEGVQLKTRHRVCRIHFSEDQFNYINLKRNAVPSPLDSKASCQRRQQKKPASTSATLSVEGILSIDKIDLLGHCVFCLKAMIKHNSNLQETDRWTSLSHLWKYIMKSNSVVKGEIVEANFSFIQSGNQGGELMTSQVPPMCSSCLPKLRKLNDLHQELEQIRKKLKDVTANVNDAASSIRETLVKSEVKRYNISKDLENSNLPSPCLPNTTKFLDCLFGPLTPSHLPRIAPNPASVPPNPITIIPTINPTYNKTQNLIVLNATPYLGQVLSSDGTSVLTSLDATSTSNDVIENINITGVTSLAKTKSVSTNPKIKINSKGNTKSHQNKMPKQRPEESLRLKRRKFEDIDHDDANHESCVGRNFIDPKTRRKERPSLCDASPLDPKMESWSDEELIDAPVFSFDSPNQIKIEQGDYVDVDYTVKNDPLA